MSISLNSLKVKRVTNWMEVLKSAGEGTPRRIFDLRDKLFVPFPYFVRVKGLEPPRLAAPDPKSGASTNSATPASRPQK